MDQLRAQSHHWRERLKISTVAKTSKDIAPQRSEKLQTFYCWAASLYPLPFKHFVKFCDFVLRMYILLNSQQISFKLGSVTNVGHLPFSFGKAAKSPTVGLSSSSKTPQSVQMPYPQSTPKLQFPVNKL